MKLYQITIKGQRMARSVNSPDTPAMRVLYYMDKNGTVSNEQIESNAGVDATEIPTAVGTLRRRGMIQEV